MRQQEALESGSRDTESEKVISRRHLSGARRRALRTLCDDGPASAEEIADMWRDSTPRTARADLIVRLLWILEALDYAEPTETAGVYRATALGARALQWH
ncbi:hypothetical protein ABZ249_22950 [Nocardiopsis sp. NPDC006139]|uniref:hypothetical protein n=1 Tax=Nocardiopsis sp. NPDC006139 TaxID=3154578 RepID=UPI0033ADB381